jgi:hypothetical protein
MTQAELDNFRKTNVKMKWATDLINAVILYKRQTILYLVKHEPDIVVNHFDDVTIDMNFKQINI